ncbi:MAG: DNA recombination protein RmuC [Vicinamibacteria bacterium]|jgi:hypothetical protein|nr:DNA recombination protein RmuC [Vicinamibacteria bacterium]
MDWIGIIALVLAVIALAFYWLRRADGGVDARLWEGLTQTMAQLQAELGRVSRSQEELTQEVLRGREMSLLRLADAAQGIQREISESQRVLAEVKALDLGRARQLDSAAASLKRLEAVVAGVSSRGVAGENILERSLGQLPPDLLSCNVAFGSKIVEYALQLPGGRLLPIDSKWTSVASVERLQVTEDAVEIKRLVEQVVKDLRVKLREVVKYLDPDRTLGIALLAVPDAVYAIAPSVHGEAYRTGVLIVPYSLALPFALAIYRLTLRFGTAIDTDHLAAQVRRLDESLRTMMEEIEGRLSRGLVQLGNSRDDLRGQAALAQRISAHLLQEAKGDAAPPESAVVVRASIDDTR